MKYLFFILSLLIIISCSKNDPEPIDQFDVSAIVNGANFAMVRDVHVTFNGGELRVQGKDWVDNYMDFTVFDIKTDGAYAINTAKFIFVDDPTVSYIAEQQAGTLTVSELSDTKLSGTFSMNLNNPDGDFVEVKDGLMELQF